MTDVEIYAQWIAHYDIANYRVIVGEISSDQLDRGMANLEERLGVSNWSTLRWHRAQNAWAKGNA